MGRFSFWARPAGYTHLEVRALYQPGKGKAKGLGLRANCYSMRVRNGKVGQLNIEAPGKLEVSGADTLLRQLTAG